MGWNPSIGFVCKIKDYKVRRVTGFGRNCIFPQRPDLHDFALAILEFEDGSLGKVTSNYSSVTLTTTEFQFAAQRRVLSQAMVSQDFSKVGDDADRSLDKVVDLNEKINKSNLLRDFINNVLTGTGLQLRHQKFLKLWRFPSLSRSQSLQGDRQS